MIGVLVVASLWVLVVVAFCLVAIGMWIQSGFEMRRLRRDGERWLRTYGAFGADMDADDPPPDEETVYQGSDD